MEDKHYETMIAPTKFNEWELETLNVFDLEDNPMKRYGRDCETDYLRTNPYRNEEQKNEIN
jgi:hypothetical protein